MARRLRAAGAWDNGLADAIASLQRRAAVLEEEVRYRGVVYEKIKRPLATWKDARNLLVVIAGNRLVTFTEIPAPLATCLGLAVQFHIWEQEGKPIPADIRLLPHGAIALEWEKPYRVEIR